MRRIAASNFDRSQNAGDLGPVNRGAQMKTLREIIGNRSRWSEIAGACEGGGNGVFTFMPLRGSRRRCLGRMTGLSIVTAHGLVPSQVGNGACRLFFKTVTLGKVCGLLIKLSRLVELTRGCRRVELIVSHEELLWAALSPVRLLLHGSGITVDECNLIIDIMKVVRI